MKKLRIAFITAISILAMLSLCVGSAYCRSDSYVKTQALTFLEQVGNVDIDKCKIVSFNVSTPKMLNSEMPQTIISGIISYKGVNYSLAMAVVDEKVWFYELEPFSNNFIKAEVNQNDCLTIAKNAMANYQASFGANHCGEFAQMIPTSLQAANTTIDKDNKALETIYYDSGNQFERMTLCWFKKVDGNTLHAMSTVMEISKTGLVISFVDNLARYEVATTEVRVSEEQAVNAAMPFINSYAEENDRKITSVKATFQYSVDAASSRGDSSLIYPRWIIHAEFDDLEKYDIYGYDVMIWADTGEVYDHGSQGVFRTFPQSATPNIIYMIGVTIFAVVFSSGAILLLRHRSKKQYFECKAKSVLKNNCLAITLSVIMVSLLCSALLPICSANSSNILGSRWNINSSEEETADSNTASAIASYSSTAGYSLISNWYGSSTTASNIYKAAYGQYHYFSIAFYVGHGGHSIEWHYWGWPWQWHQHDYVAIHEDSGAWVRDNDIWQNSFYKNINSKKFVLLWSCHQAEDAMGTTITYPCGDTQYHGMPYAWIHKNTSISFDGYNYPDSSGQVFIGFQGLAPYLTNDELGVNDAGYLFVNHFYYAALVYGWTIKASLDLGAQSVWNVNYNNQACKFYSGYYVYLGGVYPEWGYGIMKVFGQGTIYI